MERTLLRVIACVENLVAVTDRRISHQEAAIAVLEQRHRDTSQALRILGELRHSQTMYKWDRRYWLAKLAALRP
jgi:hypothetical protein